MSALVDWNAFSGTHLNNPSYKRRITEFSDDEGYDISRTDDHKNLPHDTEDV